MSTQHSFSAVGIPNSIDLRNVEDVGGTVIVVKSRSQASVVTADKNQAPKADPVKSLASPIGTIILPLPKTLQFSDSIQYNEEERLLQAIYTAFINTAKTVTGAIDNVKNFADTTDLTTTQPGKMSRYENHQKNSFELNFDLHPRNAEWSKLIYKTIYALRYFAMPKWDKLEPGDRFTIWNMKTTTAATSTLYEACLFDVGFAFGDLSANKGDYDKRSKYFPYLEDAAIHSIREDISMNITPIESPSKTTLDIKFEEVIHRHANFYEKKNPSVTGTSLSLIEQDMADFGDFARGIYF